MESRIDMKTLLGRLAEHGITDESVALRSLRATLAALRERLVDDEAKVLADVVPSELVETIESTAYDSDFDAEELFERVRRRDHTTAARSKENAEVILTTLGGYLSHDGRCRIARGLPEPAAELLLGDRSFGEPPPYRVASPPPPSIPTLASARPGSSHPVSESAAPSGHTHSVARNPSPHVETKLSGAKGLTQERLEETLGAGRPPGPARPIADAGSK